MDRDPLHARRLFELSLDLLVVTDAELRILHANPAWERVLGRAPTVVIGRSFEELLHPEDVQRTRQAAEELPGSDGAMRVDNRLRHADGSLRWIRWTARAHPENGLYYAAGRDITAELEAEAQLRASERRLAEAERIAGVGAIEWSPDGDSVVWSDGMRRLYGLPADAPPLSPDELLARMRPDEAAEARAATQRAAAELSTFELDFHLLDRQGRLRAFHARGEAYVDGDCCRRLRASVQDVTRLRLQSQQQGEVARLAALALAGGDRDAFFREVCAAVSRTLHTSLSVIIELQPEGGAVPVAGIGWPPGLEPGTLSPGQASLTLAAVETGRPLVVEDWRTERRYPYFSALREAGVRCTAAMPIAGRAGPLGVLATNSREPGFLQRDDLAFLEAVAAILGTAVERWRSEAEIAELAAMRGRLVTESVEAEERARRRISEELHDGVLQDLLAARQDLIEASGPTAGGLVASARAGVERAVAALREAVHALHPVVLQHGGLAAALQAAAEQAGHQGGFRTDVAVSPEAVGLRDELVLSIARELLNNAAKHAGASYVQVTVWCEPQSIVVEVDDDGRGIDLEAAATAPLRGHIGLAALAHRVEATGGTFEVSSVPGRAGTVVRAVLPLE